jgi:dihydrofolate reductase
MISAIFSVDQTGGVGNRGTLPWKHHPEDMAQFRELTVGHVVVMGRKTWDDPMMPKPLPDRVNIIATNRAVDHPLVRTIRGDLPTEIEKLQGLWPKKNIYIIGGVDLLMQCKGITDRVYVTHRKGSYYADTRLNMGEYFMMFRAWSARPSTDKMLNFTEYKNINPFRSQQ